MLTHLLFIAFVVLAVYTQNLTGFAFALILLGLVGLFNLVPLPDASNAITVLTIVNALMFFYRRRTRSFEPAIYPSIAANLVGVLAGMALLTFLAANAYDVLRLIFGVSVVSCALLLWRTIQPHAKPSGAGYFAFVGSMSGILGGLFSAPGPPLVYAVYRQPWTLQRMQEALILSFGIGAILRLFLVVLTGQFSHLSLILAMEAIPIVLAVTGFFATRPSPISQAAVRKVVCVLLIISGLGMILSSTSSMYKAQGASPEVVKPIQ